MFYLNFIIPLKFWIAFLFIERYMFRHWQPGGSSVFGYFVWKFDDVGIKVLKSDKYFIISVDDNLKVSKSLEVVGIFSIKIRLIFENLICVGKKTEIFTFHPKFYTIVKIRKNNFKDSSIDTKTFQTFNIYDARCSVFKAIWSINLNPFTGIWNLIMQTTSCWLWSQSVSSAAHLIDLFGYTVWN